MAKIVVRVEQGKGGERGEKVLARERAHAQEDRWQSGATRSERQASESDERTTGGFADDDDEFQAITTTEYFSNGTW